jgi:uncharacterized protein (TIGR03663 family)
MLSALRRWWPLVLITGAALWLRTHELARRPMHADEANQAVKTGHLLETGYYAFDPQDHHGPTLYYLALPVAWLRGERTLAQLGETTVRLVPALLGTAAVVLLGLIAAAAMPAAPEQPKGPPWRACAAALFFAVSPPAVYYARYFIQETLLLAFTLGLVFCAQQWWRRRTTAWALLAGACLGLMQATKASAPLFAGCALLAALLARGERPTRARAWLRPLALALAAALVVAVAFYSSFGTHLRGLRDAVAVYSAAFTRVAGAASGHEKPWWYYLQLFAWQRSGGLVWQQLAFSALALAGAVVAWRSRDRFLRAAALHTLLVALALSAVAYKTPWHAIHLVPGLALLAAGALGAPARLRTGKFVGIAAAVLVAGMLFQQTARAAFLRPADARNPYAYVHSSFDVLKIRPLAEAALARDATQPVRIVSEEYWPLPWYLRGLPRVGYWSEAPPACDGALVIASLPQAAAVRARLRGNYRESFVGLRPGVLLVVFTPEASPAGLRD